MNEREPLVSVVIPTWRRPELLLRAVHSALGQTLEAVEVIVVVDGPDKATEQVLRSVDDPRLRVHVLPRNMGAPDARNTGIGLARGKWISPLDDDDEFLPPKLEIQLRTARQSRHRFPIIACRVLVQTPNQQLVWPRRVPRADEPISEYLFCRSSPFFGEGVLPTHAIFVSKELMQLVPYMSGLPRGQDLDWTLRATAVEGASVEFVDTKEPLAVWHMQLAGHHTRPRLKWDYGIQFIRARRHLVTPRAYAGFLLTWKSSTVRHSRRWRAFWPTLREALRYGQPSIMDVLFYLAYWLLPWRLRTGLAGLFARFETRSRPENE